jgi:phage gp36-like protein
MVRPCQRAILMSYCTSDQLVARFGLDQLLAIADHSGDDALDVTSVDAAIADAAAEIESYLRRRYALPLVSVDPALAAIACDIAFYRLHPADQPDDVRRRYEDARRWLGELAAGRIEIDTGAPAGTGGSGEARVSAPARVFTRDTLSGF